eukprot:1139079-Pelagomonas_calceolata.AAC.6
MFILLLDSKCFSLRHSSAWHCCRHIHSCCSKATLRKLNLHTGHTDLAFPAECPCLRRGTAAGTSTSAAPRPPGGSGRTCTHSLQPPARGSLKTLVWLHSDILAAHALCWTDSASDMCCAWRSFKKRTQREGRRARPMKL